MFLAEEAAKESAGTFAFFDLFIIVFTIILVAAVYRLAKEKKKNLFALGFATVCLLTFLAVDFLMVLSWMGELKDFQTMLFGE
jgi:hypothetical protein